MERRLYFILPDVDISRQIEDDLLLARIHEEEMHFLGKIGTDYKDLPEATAFQKTDTIHGIQIGLVTGALAGITIGLIIYSLRDYIGLQIQIGIILPALVLGGMFGLITGGFLIGSSTPNSRLKRFQSSMEEGHILLMLDVAKE